MGLTEILENYPLKVLHSKLEYYGNKQRINFIGISNYSLDANKINREMNLLSPN